MDDQTTDAALAGIAGKTITGVSVAARVRLAAHALNNEGSRNNALIPRQVDVVQGDDVIQTNAISGDSLKHTFVDHLRRVAQDGRLRDAGVPVCSACAQGDPNRLNAVPEFQQIAKSKVSNEEVIRELIQRCVIDDVAGLLITQGNRNAPRRSAAQFGWELGVPDRVRTGRYMHLKLVAGSPSAESTDGSNLGQNLFTRPASSGDYAFVAQLDLARIGVNDITWRPAIPEDARQHRQAAALEALYLTLANHEGAQCNTQLPHLAAASGAVGISTSSLPPVLFSPLAEDFVAQMGAIANAFGRLGRDLYVIPFATVAELGQILAVLTGRVRPPELSVAE